jgi:type VI protein secretion system component VasK
MTYDPNANRRRLEEPGMSGGAMAGIALVLALLVGVMIWAFTGDRQTASTTPAPSTTTGQGTDVSPGKNQNVPNATPPAQPPQAK